MTLSQGFKAQKSNSLGVSFEKLANLLFCHDTLGRIHD